jgi:hypothetical protein
VFLSAIPEINGSGQEEFLDVDIDRSEFDKYLSGYGANHASSVVMAQTHALTAAGCSYYGTVDHHVTLFEASRDPKEINANNNGHEHPLIKSEPAYDTIPGASLSSALADVRSMYYDC